MGFDPGLKPKQIISNEDIVSIFKCGNMGGMRRSHATNTLVIVSDYTKGLYQDKWIGDTLHYTGMGKKGDQSIDATQNRTLNESGTNGVAVFLFEVFNKKEYTYIGEVELAAAPYQENQPDEDQVMRKVWLFPLRVKEASSSDDIDLAEKVLEEVVEIEANTTIDTTEKLTLIKSRVGHGELKKSLLAQDKKCKICGLDDERFLIASHIKPWSQSTDQERLDIDNVLLLCPHHDAAFDKGYITFDDEGKLCISQELSGTTQMLLNLQVGKGVKLTKGNQKYLEWHRENVFN